LFETGKQWLSEGLSGILNLVFPPRCAGLRRIDLPQLCDDCRAALEWLDPQEGCAKCGEPDGELQGSGNKLCPRCRERPPRFSSRGGCIAVCPAPSPGRFVLWKYENQRSLTGSAWRPSVRGAADRMPHWFEKVDAVVPVPHHLNSVRSRGFSPPEDIGRIFAGAYNIPLLPEQYSKSGLPPHR